MAEHVPHEGTGKAKSNAGKSKSEENSGIGVVDTLRIIAGLLLINCVASYFVTGDSVTWNYRPWWIRPKVLAARLVSPDTAPPIHTVADLTFRDPQ